MMSTFLNVMLYNENILKNRKNIKNKNMNNNQNINNQNMNNNQNINNQNNKKNNFEENKKIILDSFANYPRLELIKKHKIQTYQFLMNKNYRNVFLKFLIIPLTFELCYNILLRKV